MNFKGGWDPRGLETVLGPSGGRYFGQGYREVRHEVRSMSRSSDDAVALSARISYPSGWSLDEKGRDRQPHLSTIDAVILGFLALEHLGEGEDAQVSRVDLRAGGRPWTDVGEVPVQLSLESAEALADGRTRRSFLVVTGNIRARIEIISGRSATSPGEYPGAARAGVVPRVYESLYRSTTSASVITGYEPEHVRLTGVHHFANDGLAPESAAVGLEGDYWPALSVVDYLVTMGQMAQALIALHHARGRSGTLWMRNMSIRLPGAPQSLPTSINSSMSAVRDKLIHRQDLRYRDIAVEATTSSRVQVDAQLALEDAQ